ncbi:hypothetical protein GCM10007384_06570 [Aquimarina muelleri]|uniref:KTSC domain-containing protein n=2 Tax=Aquimarina muelleri TaxID=279356 RepID=A0A918N2U4_9FLAO|nr:hypothetical protein GCM10007384_06570 [Aquimarina muelleri]
MLKIACALLLLSTYNCAPSKGGKDTANTSNSPVIAKNENATDMQEKGFAKGTILVNKSKDCPYILNVEAYKDNLDPININEFFKTEIPEQVWIKFASLRMPSRCNDARPVSISEIHKRKE